MKLALFKWNISFEGKNKPISYYGYKTKSEALKFVKEWNANHEMKIELIKLVNNKWETLKEV